jgi:hypothetical protein
MAWRPWWHEAMAQCYKAGLPGCTFPTHPCRPCCPPLQIENEYGELPLHQGWWMEQNVTLLHGCCLTMPHHMPIVPPCNALARPWPGPAMPCRALPCPHHAPPFSHHARLIHCLLPPPGFCGEDKEYLRRLIDITRTHLSSDVLLFSTDPPGVASRGSIMGDELYTVVDFGPGEQQPWTAHACSLRACTWAAVWGQLGRKLHQCTQI